MRGKFGQRRGIAVDSKHIKPRGQRYAMPATAAGKI
jgi:hypothetical protein